MSQFALFDFLNWFWRLLLAQALTLLFLFLNVVSLSLPHAGDLKPFFILVAIYYWSINRPTVMPIFYTFFLGLLLDILGDMPLGVSAFILVVVQTIVLKSRLYLMGQPFVMVWLGFLIVSFIYGMLLWFLLSLSKFDFFPAESFVKIMVAAFLTTLIFPALSWVLQAVHRLLPSSYNALRGAS